jgi:hypothetical protein
MSMVSEPEAGRYFIPGPMSLHHIQKESHPLRCYELFVDVRHACNACNSMHSSWTENSTSYRTPGTHRNSGDCVSFAMTDRGSMHDAVLLQGRYADSMSRPWCWDENCPGYPASTKMRRARGHEEHVYNTIQSLGGSLGMLRTSSGSVLQEALSTRA